MKIFAKIRGIYAAVIIILFVLLNILLFTLFDKKYYKKIKQFISKSILKLLGIDIKTEGKIDENADMLVMNHKSMLDIIIMEAFYPKDLCWIAKKELFDMPLFGLMLKLPDNIAIDRQDKKGILHLLKETKKKVKNSHKVLAIFPEGTRAKGDRLLPFKPGASVIADKLDMRVQPIVIINSREIFDSKKLELNPGTVKIKFLPSFKAKENPDWLKNLRDEMQKILDSEKNCDK
ncbi:lysophospholipid acyltransferase family protein [Nitrosophilus alvini]|uniref:lysophospholipid acyltransferase family protein n=1 Tax=Nitrosophilus alvini TaxID=2714855 RepID=UPI00190D1120|nr:lysophospholipid acyltransferase family protein [Nitrosophilus alvini]